MRYPPRLSVVGLAVVLAACGGSDSSSENQGDSPGASDNTAPVARITGPSRVVSESEVTLSAAQSSDPDGDALSHRWRITEHPQDATPSLNSPQSEETQLTWSQTGAYIIELEVSDGDQRATTTHTLNAATNATAMIQQADLGDDQAVMPQEPVTASFALPAQASEALAGAVSVDWRFCHRPDASNARLQMDGVNVSFTPDTVGHYCIEAAATRGDEAVGRFRKQVVADETAGEGARFYGTGGTTVRQATFDFYLPSDNGLNKVSTDPDNDQRILRTEIVLEFAAETPIGEANDLLQAIDGRIVAMNSKTDSAIVRIPDPGSLAELRQTLEELRDRAILVAADESPLARKPVTQDAQPSSERLQVQSLPGNISHNSGAQISRIAHHLAVRGHAAWNMQSFIPQRLSDRPWIIVTDYFGNGQPDNDYAAMTRSGDFRDFNPKPNRDDCGWREPCLHGYHVLGIMLGNYGGGSNDRDQVTGLYPKQLRVRAFDTSGVSSLPRIKSKIIKLAKQIRQADSDANIVVNTSIGLNDPNDKKVNRQARRYIKAIRNKGLESHLVHAVSAGNVDDGNAWPAFRNSGFTYAALGTVNKPFGNTMPNVDNVLVVENQRNWNHKEIPDTRAQPRCLSDRSLRQGNISAIGSGVFSFGRENDQVSDGRGTSSISGTSMASPQTAALAAYVWSMNDQLSATKVVDIIQNTGRGDYPRSANSDCHNQQAQPAIDALDALRAADQTTAARALYDVADRRGAPGSNGRFDEHDLDRFLDSRGPTPFNYGRLDLNGDGHEDLVEGSNQREPVDLDGDAAHTNPYQADLLGYQATYDETAVSDLDMLCHDAFTGSAFQGDPKQRNGALGELCGLVDVTLVNPSGDLLVINQGQVTPVTARVEVNTQHRGEVSLHIGGTIEATKNGVANTEVTLHTDPVCNEDSQIEVRFTDASSGLRASDQVALDVSGQYIAATIDPPKPKYARVEQGPNGPEVTPFLVKGAGEEPTCDHPESGQVEPDQQLVWLDGGGRVLRDAQNNRQTGEQARLTPSYFADGNGGFEAQSVGLQFTASDGRTTTDTVAVEVCTPDKQTGDSVPGYQICPISGSQAGYLDSIEQAIAAGSLVNIIRDSPVFERVIDRFGLDEGCDPRTCDPKASGFPAGAMVIDSQLREGGWNPELVTYLTGDGILAALNAESIAAAEQQLADLSQSFAENETLTGSDRELLLTAYSTARAALDFFGSPEDDTGANGWSRILTETELANFRESGADRLKAARQAVRGLLAAVVKANVRSEYASNQFVLNAGRLGSLYGASDAIEQTPGE